MVTKFMLASDFDENKVKYPCFVQPKIDGVRAGNLDGKLTGRSLKPHRNKFTTAKFSGLPYLGFDGELSVHNLLHPNLCSLTTSATSRIEGEPHIMWNVFDLILPRTINLPYSERFAELSKQVDQVNQFNDSRVSLIDCWTVDSEEELLDADQYFTSRGYEGTIIRDPNGMYKQGRSTVKEGGLLRIKRFISEEALVIGINEGEHNANEAQINERGLTFRTSHQENKIPNGQVGSLACTILKDSALFKKGDSITVSKGEMTTEEAKDFFNNPCKIVGQVIKFKHFPKGVKDKPRFPTFQCIRSAEDQG